MRYLALDWGTVRVGAAMSDSEGRIAFPLKEPFAKSKALDEIKKICAEESVEKILMGLPKSLDGEEGKSSDEARKFGEKLTEATGLPVELVDERFSSVAAGKTLSASGMSEKGQRQIKDNVSASLILQAYLDTNNK